MLAPDDVLQNRYRIVRRLGHGGMGAVYEAIDRRLSAIVAVKETFAMTEEGRAAFLREAKILANLDHEAFPKVSDYFEEGEGMYLVMQLIRGNDLEELLKLRESPFSTVKVLEWADQLLDALEDLHKTKPPIIHRDIKPSNLKLTKRGKIILLDFGIAKGAAGQMSTLKTDGSLGAATPYFAPLEQVLRIDPSSVKTLSTISRESVDKILGKGTDPRSDLYALGATLYLLLTCELPDDARFRAMAVWSGKPDPLQPADLVNPQVPPAVSAILMQAMSLERSERPHDAVTMRRLLREAVREPVVIPPTIAPDEELIRKRKEEEARRHAEAEAERKRLAEEERQREEEETRRQEAETKRQREAEAAARRIEEERQAKERQEQERLRQEEERKRREEEEARLRQLAEAETLRKDAEEKERQRLETEAEAARLLAAEQEAARLAEEESARAAAERERRAKAEQQRLEAEEAARRAEEDRKRREEMERQQRAEEERQRLAAEDEERRKRAEKQETEEETLQQSGKGQSTGGIETAIPTLPAGKQPVIYSKPEESPPPPQPAPPPPAPRSYKMLYLALGAVILIASLSILYAYISSRRGVIEPQPNTPEKQTNSTPAQPATLPNSVDITNVNETPTPGDNDNARQTDKIKASVPRPTPVPTPIKESPPIPVNSKPTITAAERQRRAMEALNGNSPRKKGKKGSDEP